MSNYKSRFNIAPSDYIRRELEFRGWSQKEFAERIGYSQNTISAIMQNKQSISTDMAKALQDLFGETVEFWLTVEAKYRARLVEESTVLADPSAALLKTCKLFPLGELRTRFWLQAKRTLGSVESDLIRLFGRDALLSGQLCPTGAMLRQSAIKKTEAKLATLTWERIAYLCAAHVDTRQYSRSALEDLQSRLAPLTIAPDGVREFVEGLEGAGVKFFVLKPFHGTGVDGMCFIDAKSGNPVIVYSGRYGRSDHFWFTMAHEIGHVLNDLNAPVVIDEAETMADEYARSTLHMGQILAMFGKNTSNITRAKVLSCAYRLNISLAVVVGVLHYYDRLDYGKMADLTPSILSALAPWSGIEAMVAPYSNSKHNSDSGAAIPQTV